MLTGKPLGITGKVAEYEAARILGVELTPARRAGYDAIETAGSVKRTLQIKGRCLPTNCRPGQRSGSIDIRKYFDATAIYEAERQAILDTLAAPGSISRNERGALAVSESRRLAGFGGNGQMIRLEGGNYPLSSLLLNLIDS